MSIYSDDIIPVRQQPSRGVSMPMALCLVMCMMVVTAVIVPMSIHIANGGLKSGNCEILPHIAQALYSKKDMCG